LKAVVLAAGYATRLRPLTDAVPKQLLPVGGRPMLDWILDKVRELEPDEIHLVTNARFTRDFERWAEGTNVRVHDDGTTSNDDRLGAVGDLRFLQERADLDTDVLVIAGDNLFDFSLCDYSDWWRAKNGSAVAVYDVGDAALATQYGIVTVDELERIVEFVEKPADPPSTLAATAAYLFRREHAQLVAPYLDEGNPPDQPGNFVAWLCAREPVYAYRIAGGWWDIGDHGQLLEADNRMRARSGLPVRDTYSLQS